MPIVVVPIRRMHCKSCVLLLESAIKEVPGVRSVHVSLKKRQASIHADEAIDLPEVHAAIEGAGYQVGEHTEVPWLVADGSEYALLMIAGVLALTLAVLVRAAGLGGLFSSSAQGTGFLTVFLVGLTAGVSTCMALVGGLVLAVSARYAERHPRSTALQKFRPHLFFNGGRVVSFFLLGGLLGSMGGFFQPTPLWFGIMTIAVGLVMFLLGVQLLEISPRLSRFHVALPASAGRMFGFHRTSKGYSHGGTFLAGALTFFLPCGFTQAMQVAAIASRGFLPGALIMGVFALGTLPGLLGIGGLSSVVRGFGARLFFKVTGIIVIALAAFNFTNGYRLTGWPVFWPAWSVVSGDDQMEVLREDGVQVVRMRQLRNSYTPNVFRVKRGIPVHWIIDSTTAYSCSSTIVVPSLGIQRSLFLGENVIEFTPQEAGIIRFSCSMGMYSGQFIVTD